jgi:hypothetical protein
VILTVLGLAGGLETAWAAPQYQPFRVNLFPQSWQQIQAVVDPDNENPGVNIPANLQEALCGGWNVEESVGNALGNPGKIAKVQGVPGREGSPLGNIFSGMAVKQGDLIYPTEEYPVGEEDTTCGFTSACWPTWPYEQIFLTTNYQRPAFYSRMPCQRPLGPWVDTVFEEDCDGRCCVEEQCVPESAAASAALKYACGGGDMEAAQGRFCAELYNNGESDGLCQKLNDDWVYTMWARPHFVDDPSTPEEEYIHIGWFLEKGVCRKTVDRFDQEQDEQPEWAQPGWWAANQDHYDAKFAYLGGFLQSNIPDKAGNTVDWQPWEFRPAEPNDDRYCCTDYSVGEIYRNCMRCAGEDCRTGPEFQRIFATGWYCLNYHFGRAYIGPAPAISECTANGSPALPRRQPWQYTSYYRHYEASYERAPVESVADDDFQRPKDPDDPEQRGIPVSCYGWWHTVLELNSAINKASPSYRRCVIASYYEPGTPYGDNEFFLNDGEDDMRETQQAKGEYGPPEPYPDPPELDGDPLDDGVRRVFETGDLWYAEVGDGFALVNGVVLEQEYENDLSSALLSLDTARQRSGVPFDLQKNESEALLRVRSSGALLRGFDDTGLRSFTEWWQRQQTAANDFFSPPVVRLILPSGWSVGLDPLNPLFTPELPYLNGSAWDENPLEQPIEVQLEMRAGLLGQVAEYLRGSLLLQFEEEKIPVALPLASATELRAISQGWCGWYMARNNEDDCEDVSGALGDFLTQLEKYARYVEDARALRGELGRQLAAYLEANNSIQDSVTEWIYGNTVAYNTYLEERQQRLDLQRNWRAAQATYQRFQDQTNLPWCRNDRFTPPIYSLLDPWYNSGARDLAGTGLPELPRDQQPDVVLDFSHLSIGSTGAVIRIPVLEPIQLQLDTERLAPPQLNAANASIPTLPDPPVLPLLSELTEASPLPTSESVVTADFPTVATLAPSIAPGNAAQTLGSITTLISGMNSAYQQFWGSMTIDPEDIWDGTEEDCYQHNERTSFGQRTAGRCVHVEEDLIERFTRIAARPGIQLREDLLSIGEGFLNPYEDGFDVCPYEDWVCVHLNAEVSYPRIGWHLTSSGSLLQNETLEEARRVMMEASLQFGVTDANQLVPYNVPRNQILPSFAEPMELNLYILEEPSAPPSSS